MSISFPNGSRSYDATRRRVRFWGYDSALEISFFVDAGALDAVQASSETAGDGEDQAEAQALQAFDEGLDRIREVAASIYASRHGFAHVLTAADFRAG